MAISDVSLTAGMRSNLTNLQSTVTLLNRTQERLASGKKVNSALDNPINFFTAKSHRSDAADLSTYKDGMNEGVQTIKQANNGITAITALIDSAKALASSAKSKVAGSDSVTETLTLNQNLVRADALIVGGTTYTAGNKQATITATDVATAGQKITIDGTEYTGVAGAAVAADGEFSIDTGEAEMMTSLAAAVNYNTTGGAATGISAVAVLGVITLTSSTGVGIDVADITEDMANTAVTQTASTGDFQLGADAAATAINLAAAINGDVPGGFSATSVSGSTITISGATDVLDGTITTAGVTNAATKLTENLLPGADDERGSLAEQYNEIQSQIATMISDSGYGGTNLLTVADTLAVDFGNGHNIAITGFDAASNVGNSTATATWAANTDIDTDIAALDSALSTMQIQAANLSNNLSVISVRQDFSTAKINELVAGADNLTLADMNEEGANMLMLQTRQSLSTTALSMSAQASQSVLRLFQ